MPLPLAKFANAVGALKILQGGSIFITSPLDLNDSFEMRPGWTANHDLAQQSWRKTQSEWVGGAGREPMPPVERQFRISDDQNEMVFEGLHKRFAVLSLVRSIIDKNEEDTASDILMWAHYADQYQGVCLLIDGEKFNNGIKPGGYDVTYGPNRKFIHPLIYTMEARTQACFDPVFCKAFVDAKKCELIEVLKAKSPAWAYEKEVRMIYDLHNLSPEEDFKFVKMTCPDCSNARRTLEQCNTHLLKSTIKLPSECITGVVFGADTPSPCVIDILEVLEEERYKDVKVYASGLHSDKYLMQYLELPREDLKRDYISQTTRIARVKGHTVYKYDRCGYTRFASIKGVNYRPS